MIEIYGKMYGIETKEKHKKNMFSSWFLSTFFADDERW